MKNKKLKSMDWKRGNRIMKKYGESIRREIERTFIKTAASLKMHEGIRKVDKATRPPAGAHTDPSQPVSWVE